MTETPAPGAEPPTPAQAQSYGAPGYGPPGYGAPVDFTPEQADIQQNKAMAVIAYIGILVLIPILAAKDSRFARYHANQGLVLLLAEIAVGVAAGLLSVIFAFTPLARLSVLVWLVGWAASMGGFVFMILGIVNAAQGQFKPLPLIGTITLLR
jgi:uncharacterized membrane protein